MEDDLGTSYYYRGDIDNNYVSYAGHMWRIIRRNGDGSVRMIYSGVIDDKKQFTGQYASIKNSNNKYTTSFGVISSKTGKVNITAPTYLGYMYNPEMILYTSPNYKLKGEDDSSIKTLKDFPEIIPSNNSYYFFNSFDLNTNCSLEDETCTLTCTNFDESTGKGDNCVYSLLGDMTNGENNAVYDESKGSTGNIYNYVSPYKYSCFSDAVKSTDGNTLTIKCPLVREIMGVIKQNDGTFSKTNVRARYHGLFSENKDIAQKNVLDSNLKKEIDLWYENNIMDRTDSKNNLLSNYLQDSIFCNDRYVYQGNGYNFDTINFSSYGQRGNISATKVNPVLKCMQENDRFTVNKSVGKINTNGDLKYPIATITIDEFLMTGPSQNYGNPNKNIYLYINHSFWTMSPSSFHQYFGNIREFTVYANGVTGVNLTDDDVHYGIRPVINIKSDIKIKKGAGTVDEPYILTLN